MELDTFLEHHGIKGMKWGVRRDPGTDGLVGPRSVHSPGGVDGNPRTSADFERFTTAMAKARSKGITSLSNEELKLVANRIKNENDFAKQTTERALASRSMGRKIIDSFVTKATDTASEMAAAQGKKLVQEFFDNRNKKPPTLLEKIKAENEIMKVQKDHLQLISDLSKHGFYNTTVPLGSGMKVNPSKVKVTPTPLHNLPKLKNP